VVHPEGVEPLDPSVAEPDFLGLELALAERRSAGVVGGFAAVVDEAFVEFGASGRRWDRRTILQLLAEPGDAEVTIDDFDVLPLAEGVRLVTYRASTRGRRSLRASIWVRRRGRWRLRFHQGTRIESEG
jgi:hypothetical protein